MNHILLYLLDAVAAYLICGLNPSIILSELLYHEDIRTRGSGNPGFTNFKRVYGKTAWIVFAADLLKSIVLCLIFCPLFRRAGLSWSFGAAFTGFFGMLGHCFPVWYHGKGGKGFLVGAAAIWFVDWRAGLIALGVMMILLFTVKYMSLSVMCAAVTCPVTLLVTGADPGTFWFCLAGVLLLIARHAPNIRKLADGTESKFSLSDHKKNEDHEIKTEK